MARNKNNSVQDDKFNPPVNGEENVQNDKGAAASEDVRNETDNGDQEIEDSFPDGENQEQSEHVPQILTATYPILYLSHQYKIGDELPTNDPEMVKAWLTAKTAVWTPAKAGKEGSGK